VQQLYGLSDRIAQQYAGCEDEGRTPDFIVQFVSQQKKERTSSPLAVDEEAHTTHTAPIRLLPNLIEAGFLSLGPELSSFFSVSTAHLPTTIGRSKRRRPW
jgi:hypothetical protein